MQLVRPQPVGIFPFPASHLLLVECDSDQASAALTALMKGDENAELPAPWRFFHLAIAGDLVQARQMLLHDLPHCPPSQRAIVELNLFILEPSIAAYERFMASDHPDCLKQLLHSAAFVHGLVDDLPTEWELDNELLAQALATSAAAELERGNQATARAQLKLAIAAARPVSPLFAAQLLAEQSQLTSATGGTVCELAVRDLRDALQLAQDSQLSGLLPDLYSRLGMALHQAAAGDRSRLLEAVSAYQAAIRSGLSETADPYNYALLQNNLGLAYLSMPQVGSTHQLRSGIAVQSFRQALAVLNEHEHTDLWASISMNLASALVYLPSSHPQENLIQAVELYEQVLQIRPRAKDPVAYALVLLNQANALSHLGIFKPALEKLAEAYKLFQCHDQTEQAAAARELIDQIHTEHTGHGQLSTSTV